VLIKGLILQRIFLPSKRRYRLSSVSASILSVAHPLAPDSVRSNIHIGPSLEIYLAASMTQPSRTREYLYPEEPVQVEICSKQGVKPEVWWSEFRRNGERGPHATEASMETAAGIKQKILSRYKTKSMKIDPGRKVDICLRFSPDMPMIAEKDFALGLLLVACDPRDPYLYSVTVSICERAFPMDGGPAFTLNALKSASFGDSVQSLKANVSVVTSGNRRWWRSDFTFRPFLSSGISREFIVIGEREVSNAQWKYMNRPQSSVLRLLEDAERTGDVIIVGKVRIVQEVLAFVSRNICAPGLILESSRYLTVRRSVNFAGNYLSIVGKAFKVVGSFSL
jgi:hypothetical protein